MPRVLSPPDYLRKILDSRVYEIATETPLHGAARLSRRFGHDILIKREDMQPTFCYKIRGAYNCMAHLDPGVLQRGVVVASAGNHAQGVAISARRLGSRALVVMPVTTPSVKIDAVRQLGGKIRLVGDSFDEALAHARAVCEDTGRPLISPFDDPDIIAGQGTVGMEVLHQHQGTLDAIFVPVGGGGLIAGIAAYVKQVRPQVRIIGVEPFESDTLYQSLRAGRRVRLKKVGIFADGVAVRQIGRENFRLCRELVDEVVRVDTDEICAAIKDVYEDLRTVLEPSGALAVAGIKRWIQDRDGTRREQSAGRQDGGVPHGRLSLAAIASGANMNFDRLRHVSERAEIGEKREAILAVTIPEQRGSFRRFYRTLGKRSISEFNYRYAATDQAQIFVGLQIGNPGEVEALIAKLTQRGIASIDLTDNEVAKIHARYMVGGRVAELENERLFSFEFPERPGALGKFLDQVADNFNITLFHYRNHGSDYGRVLCGMQVKPGQERDFNRFLKNLGYAYREETENPVYRLFLR